MDKGRILSVDDDQNLQMVVSQYLNADGYTVDCAYSVKEALKHAEENSYSAVLLDLGLPDGEGLGRIWKDQIMPCNFPSQASKILKAMTAHVQK